jgi:predicted phage-related endonuclease
MTFETSTGDRHTYIGGSDARTILGRDEGALLRLWQEKRGEVEPQNLDGTSPSSSVA